MLTQLGSDPGKTTIPVFAWYVHNIIVLQWEVEIAEEVYIGPTFTLSYKNAIRNLTSTKQNVNQSSTWHAAQTPLIILCF